MKYDITKTKRPKMPKLGKGTECFKLLLSQTSFDMREPLLPMLPPVLGTKISNAEFQYPSGQWLEMCGQQAVLVADSAGNKGQLSQIVEAICRQAARTSRTIISPSSQPASNAQQPCLIDE